MKGGLFFSISRRKGELLVLAAVVPGVYTAAGKSKDLDSSSETGGSTHPKACQPS